MLRLKISWPPKELSPNARTHWVVRSRVAKKYRVDAYHNTLATAPKSTLARLRGVSALGLVIEFAPPDARSRDRDNLLASIKAGLDGVADALGINDRVFQSITIGVGETVKGGEVRLEILG